MEESELLINAGNGCLMAIESCKELARDLENKELQKIILDNMEQHKMILSKIEQLVDKEKIKGINPIAQMMSSIKLSLKKEEDIAKTFYDGCSMGIKTLCKDRNSCKEIKEETKIIYDELIKIEEDSQLKVEKYL